MKKSEAIKMAKKINIIFQKEKLKYRAEIKCLIEKRFTAKSIFHAVDCEVWYVVVSNK